MNIEEVSELSFYPIIEVEKNGIKVKALNVTLSNKVNVLLYEDMFKNCTTEEEVIAKIEEAREQTPPEIDIETLKDYEFVKEKLRIGLQRNEEEGKLFINFFDIYEFVYIDLGNNGIIKVPRHLSKEWGVTTSSIFMRAKKNTKEHLTLKSIMSILFGDNPPDIAEKLMAQCPMWVGSNDSCTYGSAFMTYDSKLEQVCDELDTPGIAIIPASVHEVIIVPINEPTIKEYNVIKEMVKEVNTTEVKEEEILSTHPYIFMKDGGYILLDE